jgi:hypothetical protein
MVNAQTEKFCNTTQRHHERYDENNPLAWTIELCYTCHGRYQSKLGTWKGKIKRPIEKQKIKNIKITEEVHKKLGTFGGVCLDYSAVVEMLLKHWETCPEVVVYDKEKSKKK